MDMDTDTDNDTDTRISETYTEEGALSWIVECSSEDTDTLMYGSITPDAYTLSCNLDISCGRVLPRHRYYLRPRRRVRYSPDSCFDN